MTTASQPLVVDGLTVRYGRTVAVDGVGFSVREGQVYALLGRNGAGKSSTIACLAGQRRATAGSCRVLGLDAWHRRRRIMERVGIVPETPDLPPGSTAVELGRFLGRVRRRWSAADYAARIERVGVPPKLPVQRLSKGQLEPLSLEEIFVALCGDDEGGV